MNKSDLVAAIAETSGLTKADAARALDATTGAITGALAGGDNVAITGFGSFLVRDRADVLAATHKQVQRFKLKHLKYQHLKQVNYLKNQ